MFIVWVLQTKLLFVYNFFFFLVNIHFFFSPLRPRVELLGYVVSACLVLQETIFQSGGTILHAHQQCMSDPVFPHLSQHLVVFLFFILVIMRGIQRHLIVVIICICLMVNDVKHLFLCLFTICLSSLVKCLFM